MAIFSLSLLRQVVSPHIVGFRNHIIKAGIKPTRIRQVALEYQEGHLGVPSVIVKDIAPHWPDDPDAIDREQRFYRQLHPHLGFQDLHIYYTGVDLETQHRVIVMQDLSAGYRFPSPRHRWTWDEICCALRAYAHLHVRGRDCLPSTQERGWMFNVQEIRWSPQDLLRMADELAAWGVWGSLPHLKRLVAQTLADAQHLADYPVTVIHNDVYPPNVALPFDLNQEAVLIDWEMVGWGIAELDLAYMFMLPFRSTQNIRRQEALDYYWTQRAMLEGQRPPAQETLAVQRHADAVWSLYLIPVAHRVANKPYPPGSGPRAYWDAMFGVLYERLEELCY